jgi:ATP-dependent DNA helicase PIF1
MDYSFIIYPIDYETMAEFIPDKKFQSIITAIENGQNVFLYGPGGTGKTFLLKEIAAYLQDKGRSIGVTATTGVAALNLNIPERKIQGRTLHSWGGVGLGDEVVAKLAAKIMSKPAAKKRWIETEILIIDEVSMLGGDFFDKLDFIGRTLRQREMDPLGGIQLILSGDFLQLPPVKDEFIFQSLAWKELSLAPFIFLDPKRYDDTDYFQLLLRVRDGEPTNEDINCLYARVQAYEHFCKMVKECADETKIIKPTEAYSHRSNVEFTNDKELEKLPGMTYDFNCIDSLKQYTKNFKKDYYIKQLEDAAPQQISLKVGAQVMLKCNLSVEQGLVNGSRGVITEIDYEMEIITVKFLRGRTARIERHEWEFEDKEGKGIRSQIPLILAWACTIHKLQGCTLDFCVLDLGHTIFACGQAYVGLSRVRSLKGLFLSSFETSSIMTSKTALQYSRELQLKEKMLDDCEGSCENVSDNDSEVELSGTDLTLSTDSENDSNETKWNIDNWDEEEFIAELILDNDWIKEFDQGKFKREYFFDSDKRYDIVDKEVEKLWQQVPFGDRNLEFDDGIPCEADDCWYSGNSDRTGEYNGGYMFIPTETNVCDVCHHNDMCHIVSDTTYGFANSIRKKVITRIQQIPVKTKVVFRK